jgi:hypothetical protein
VNGSDANDGSIGSPWNTIKYAIRQSRSRSSTSITACISARGGTYYLGSTPLSPQSPKDSQYGAIVLTSIDSNLTISAYSKEKVIFSGGSLLSNLKWSLYKSTPTGNIMMSRLPSGMIFDSLHMNELYLTLAKNDSSTPERTWTAIRSKFPVSVTILHLSRPHDIVLTVSALLV